MGKYRLKLVRRDSKEGPLYWPLEEIRQDDRIIASLRRRGNIIENMLMTATSLLALGCFGYALFSAYSEDQEKKLLPLQYRKYDLNRDGLLNAEELHLMEYKSK